MPTEKDGSKTPNTNTGLTERERGLYRDLGVEEGYREVMLMRMDEMKSDIRGTKSDLMAQITALPCRSFAPPFCPTPLQPRPPSGEVPVARSKTNQGHPAITEEQLRKRDEQLKKEIEDSQEYVIAELTSQTKVTAEQAALQALQTRMDAIEQGREQARKELEAVEKARTDALQQQVQQRRGKWQFVGDMLNRYAVPAIVAVCLGLGIRCDQNQRHSPQLVQQTPSSRPMK